MFEEAPIDSQRHCRQQLCCWFSWGQNLQTFPKENSIQNAQQNTTVTQKASPKTLPKLRRPPVWPKLLYLRPNCARSGLPRSEFLEATRTFNSKTLCSVCQIVSVYFMHFDAFWCILHRRIVDFHMQFSSRHGLLRFCTRGHAFFSLSSVSFCSSWNCFDLGLRSDMQTCRARMEEWTFHGFDLRLLGFLLNFFVFDFVLMFWCDMSVRCSQTPASRRHSFAKTLFSCFVLFC